ncbi:MAG: pseudouridine-5'-phosphate glycosidase [Phycisphaeraceae bacterium]|nr:pseudouridine-5'-phosphate glycosidase [Phycisphaeraceae bacterium]
MGRLALETTILTHGVPRDAALPLARELAAICTKNGAEPALVGVFRGQPIAGMSESQLVEMLNSGEVAKANSANLGALIFQQSHASTTVAATMEIAAGAGIKVFATGGIGGVHQGFAQHLDISADLLALTRFAVAVIASGVKSILDVLATRELLETLGVPVIGFQTSEFPAFYLRESGAGVDARFDDVQSLAGFIRKELERTGRGILIVNPIPKADELDRAQFSGWLDSARSELGDAAKGRQATPALLARLHALSGGKTLEANLALIRSNVEVGSRLAAALGNH